MSDIIPVAVLSFDARQFVEEMRQRIIRGESFGITVQGTHVTLRWNDKHGLLVQVTMVVTDVDDGTEPRDIGGNT